MSIFGPQVELRSVYAVSVEWFGYRATNLVYEPAIGFARYPAEFLLAKIRSMKNTTAMDSRTFDLSVRVSRLMIVTWTAFGLSRPPAVTSARGGATKFSAVCNLPSD